jgi:hypothetical protein
MQKPAIASSGSARYLFDPPRRVKRKPAQVFNSRLPSGAVRRRRFSIPLEKSVLKVFYSVGLNG